MEILRTAAAALLSAAAMFSTAHADQPSTPFDAHPGTFVQLPRDDGFIVGICNRDRTTLLEQLRHRRELLTARRQQLGAVAGNGHLSAGDIALTILLPGGLLYAAQRHDTIRRAESLLADVDQGLRDVAAEIQAFTPKAPLSAQLR